MSRPGLPARPRAGGRDVLPTGRNLFTADPRTMPTPTAFDIGEAAAAEVLRALYAGPWRLAAFAGGRPLGLGLVAHRRRGDRAGAWR